MAGMIDIHMHVGRLFLADALTPAYLLRFMDRNGIEKAVLLPIENPEGTLYYVTTDYVLEICQKYPDRFIPFCNVDPRRGFSGTPNDFYRILREYRDRGCQGFGEVLAGLDVDNPGLQEIYAACGELKMPIIFDLSGRTCIDERGLPKFEKMIKKFSKTVFIGHGPHFWAEISADIKKTDLSRYPAGKIKRPGAVERLLKKYTNLYADLSAGSGYNAITRDPDYGYWFLGHFQDKLIFGTDLCCVNQKVPIVSYLKDALKEGRISRDSYERITRRNAKRFLKF